MMPLKYFKGKSSGQVRKKWTMLEEEVVETDHATLGSHATVQRWGSVCLQAGNLRLG